MALTLRERMDRRLKAMKTEVVTFTPHWKDLSVKIQPRRGRFFAKDRNKGGKRHNHIINNTGIRAHRIATAGMIAGTMSPSRPWFRFGTPDPALMEFMPVKVWLAKVEELIRTLFNASNLYNMAPTMMSELLLFGTSAMTHVDDLQDVMRFYTHTIGSYVIAQNERLVVDTIGREFEMTTIQMVSEFGLENVSVSVQNAYSKGDYHVWFPVVHMIEPNLDADPARARAKFKKFSSIKYEPGNNDQNKVLKHSGFDQFPTYVPRWEVAGEDIYGTNCPGMIALGDIRALQIEEKRKAQGIDKMVNPPLKGPPSLKDVPVSSLPGGLTIHAGGPNAGELKPIYQVVIPLQDLKDDIAGVERRIDEAFMVDMFLAITSMQGIQPKNELELSKRDAERLLQIGPVLEQLHGEVLNKLIDRGFNQLITQELLPPPPPELQGSPLKIIYISSLAQAQRAIGTDNIERVAGYVRGLVEAGFATAADKFDAEQSIDEFSQLVGGPPRIIRSDDAVAEIREQRAAALAQQERLANAAAGADVAKTLSEADTGGDNALTRLSEAAANQ